MEISNKKGTGIKGFQLHLKRWRRLVNMTQPQVQEETGIPVTKLSSYENGRLNPSLDTFLKLMYCYYCHGMDYTMYRKRMLPKEQETITSFQIEMLIKRYEKEQRELKRRKKVLPGKEIVIIET